jgi:cold-inducible RNA-binding protein
MEARPRVPDHILDRVMPVGFVTPEASLTGEVVMKLYVGNLSYSVTPKTLEELFGQFGEVEDVHVPTDRSTGRPRGFAFVTMPNAAEAQKAITEMTGNQIEGRTVEVNEARPRKDEGGGGGGPRRDEGFRRR